eukprot:TRINITY_DN408_c0_g1_i1.p1 TRINITY_DN408_c0_g1~~TRINITY_DN408_c0_g1_i1.p1  ORF type:complete len:1606 (-),score=366.34 TRINITY_DN408_c0_g1_i1:2050-6867(-)
MGTTVNSILEYLEKRNFPKSVAALRDELASRTDGQEAENGGAAELDSALVSQIRADVSDQKTISFGGPQNQDLVFSTNSGQLSAPAFDTAPPGSYCSPSAEDEFFMPDMSPDRSGVFSTFLNASTASSTPGGSLSTPSSPRAEEAPPPLPLPRTYSTPIPSNATAHLFRSFSSPRKPQQSADLLVSTTESGTGSGSAPATSNSGNLSGGFLADDSDMFAPIPPRPPPLSSVTSAPKPPKSPKGPKSPKSRPARSSSPPYSPTSLPSSGEVSPLAVSGGLEEIVLAPTTTTATSSSPGTGTSKRAPVEGGAAEMSASLARWINVVASLKEGLPAHARTEHSNMFPRSRSASLPTSTPLFFETSSPLPPPPLSNNSQSNIGFVPDDTSHLSRLSFVPAPPKAKPLSLPLSGSTMPPPSNNAAGVVVLGPVVSGGCEIRPEVLENRRARGSPPMHPSPIIEEEEAFEEEVEPVMKSPRSRPSSPSMETVQEEGEGGVLAGEAEDFFAPSPPPPLPPPSADAAASAAPAIAALDTSLNAAIAPSAASASDPSTDSVAPSLPLTAEQTVPAEPLPVAAVSELAVSPALSLNPLQGHEVGEEDYEVGFVRRVVEDEEWFMANEVTLPGMQMPSQSLEPGGEQVSQVESSKEVPPGDDEIIFSGEEYYHGGSDVTLQGGGRAAIGNEPVLPSVAAQQTGLTSGGQGVGGEGGEETVSKKGGEVQVPVEDVTSKVLKGQAITVEGNEVVQIGSTTRDSALGELSDEGAVEGHEKGQLKPDSAAAIAVSGTDGAAVDSTVDGAEGGLDESAPSGRQRQERKFDLLEKQRHALESRAVPPVGMETFPDLTVKTSNEAKPLAGLRAPGGGIFSFPSPSASSPKAAATPPPKATLSRMVSARNASWGVPGKTPDKAPSPLIGGGADVAETEVSGEQSHGADDTLLSWKMKSGSSPKASPKRGATSESLAFGTPFTPMVSGEGGEFGQKGFGGVSVPAFNVGGFGTPIVTDVSSSNQGIGVTGGDEDVLSASLAAQNLSTHLSEFVVDTDPSPLAASGKNGTNAAPHLAVLEEGSIAPPSFDLSFAPSGEAEFAGTPELEFASQGGMELEFALPPPSTANFSAASSSTAQQPDLEFAPLPSAVPPSSDLEFATVPPSYELEFESQSSPELEFAPLLGSGDASSSAAADSSGLEFAPQPFVTELEFAPLPSTESPLTAAQAREMQASQKAAEERAGAVEQVPDSSGTVERAPEVASGSGELSESALDSSNDDEFEVFNLKVIHRKNRTGFEEEKDFPVVINSVVAGRYHVTEYLGSAAFSKAIQAHDLETGQDVCMKIIKNNKDFFDQSLDEVKLLKYINAHDPNDEHHLLRLFDFFYHREHLFIVCELLRANLYEFQKYNRESGGEPYFTMARLQSITKQCLEALRFLHSLGLLHCDLKPENILVQSYSKCRVKVIDMGSSCFQTDHLCSYVQSRSYRAPEVILGLPYGQKIDIWSLGCILGELWTGQVLFQNDSVAGLLAHVVGVRGPIEPHLLAKGRDVHKFFTRHNTLYERNPDTKQLELLIPKKSSLKQRLPGADPGFIDFVDSLLQVDPEKRPTALEALSHPWLAQPYEPIGR